MSRVREAYREWAERFDAVGMLLGTLGPKLNEAFEERRREAFEAGYAARDAEVEGLQAHVALLNLAAGQTETSMDVLEDERDEALAEVERLQAERDRLRAAVAKAGDLVGTTYTWVDRLNDKQGRIEYDDLEELAEELGNASAVLFEARRALEGNDQ